MRSLAPLRQPGGFIGSGTSGTLFRDLIRSLVDSTRQRHVGLRHTAV
jgi:hypothetical protein